MFTAPYRLCEGGCKGENNFAMVFPLFIGKKGKIAYQSIYPRDYSTAKNKNPPFKPLQTRLPYTTCSPFKNSNPMLISSGEKSESTTVTSVKVPITLKCPKLAKCKPRHHKLLTNSPVQNFHKHTPSKFTVRLRSTLRPLWQGPHRQGFEYGRNRNHYEPRPYRTI